MTTSPTPPHQLAELLATDAAATYTISVVRHDVHPMQRTDDDPPPVQIVSCTAPRQMAAAVLRAAADQFDPPRPVMRRAPVPTLPAEG